MKKEDQKGLIPIEINNLEELMKKVIEGVGEGTKEFVFKFKKCPGQQFLRYMQAYLASGLRMNVGRGSCTPTEEGGVLLEVVVGDFYSHPFCPCSASSIERVH